MERKNGQVLKFIALDCGETGIPTPTLARPGSQCRDVGGTKVLMGMGLETSKTTHHSLR